MPRFATVATARREQLEKCVASGPVGGSRWALRNRQALGSRHRQAEPENDRLESRLLAMTRRPMPMASRMIMAKGVGVGLGSQPLPDLLDLTVRDQATVPLASYAHR